MSVQGRNRIPISNHAARAEGHGSTFALGEVLMLCLTRASGNLHCLQQDASPLSPGHKEEDSKLPSSNLPAQRGLSGTLLMSSCKLLLPSPWYTCPEHHGPGLLPAPPAHDRTPPAQGQEAHPLQHCCHVSSFSSPAIKIPSIGGGMMQGLTWLSGGR